MDTGRERLRAALDDATDRMARGVDFRLTDVAESHGVPITSLSSAFRHATGQSFRKARRNTHGVTDDRWAKVVRDAIGRMDRLEFFYLLDVVRDHGLDAECLSGLSKRLKDAGRPYLVYRAERLAERLAAVEKRIAMTGESFYRACTALGYDPRMLAKYQQRVLEQAAMLSAVEGRIAKTGETFPQACAALGLEPRLMERFNSDRAAARKTAEG